MVSTLARKECSGGHATAGGCLPVPPGTSYVVEGTNL